MQDLEVLSLLAELSVGFVGLFAIFLIFARREGRFTLADGLRVRVIITVSLANVFFALLPLLLSMLELQIVDVWQYSSAAMLICMIAFVIDSALRQIRLPKVERQQIGQANNIVAWGLAVAMTLASTTNAFGLVAPPSGFLFATTLVMALGLVTSNFVTIAVQRLL